MYELALRQEGENWIGETIDGRAFSAPEDYGNPWVIPARGVLELRYFSTPLPPSLDDVVSADHIEQIISHVSSQAGTDNSNTVSNDKAGRDLLLSHAKEHVFNCNQVTCDKRRVSSRPSSALSSPAPHPTQFATLFQFLLSPGACPPQDNLDTDGASLARYRHVSVTKIQWGKGVTLNARGRCKLLLMPHLLLEFFKWHISPSFHFFFYDHHHLAPDSLELPTLKTSTCSSSSCPPLLSGWLPTV